MQPIHEQVKTDTALPVRFTVYDSDNDLIPMHWHNSLEIVYILNGIMDVTVNDRVTIVSALRGSCFCSSPTVF